LVLLVVRVDHFGRSDFSVLYGPGMLLSPKKSPFILSRRSLPFMVFLVLVPAWQLFIFLK